MPYEEHHLFDEEKKPRELLKFTRINKTEKDSKTA
jgi:hypothetical protein